jgi:hypothetical protein
LKIKEKQKKLLSSFKSPKLVPFEKWHLSSIKHELSELRRMKLRGNKDYLTKTVELGVLTKTKTIFFDLVSTNSFIFIFLFLFLFIFIFITLLLILIY